jgi:thioredoxin-like negative regulator of GroEL
MISVNQGDSPKVIDEYVKQGKFDFPIAMNAKGGPDVAQLYRVQAYPTNYLIGPDGKVLARFVGFHEGAMKDELKKLGFKL